MQSVSSKIWTRVIVSISYDDNHYTTSTSSRLYGSFQVHQLHLESTSSSYSIAFLILGEDLSIFLFFDFFYFHFMVDRYGKLHYSAGSFLF